MKKMLESLREASRQAIEEAVDMDSLEALRVRYLGKKGELTAILKQMGKLSAEERPVIGQLANEVRSELENEIESRKSALAARLQEAKLRAETLDVTMPGKEISLGKKHVMNTVLDEVVDIFIGMGFSIVDGPEIELSNYDFDRLNIPENHTVREWTDTFYITEDEHVHLRCQTSPVQVRVMESSRPPIRILSPGRVYRKDEIDATHSPMFHQIEGLVIDKGITMGDLKGTLNTLMKKLYGPDTVTRFRPHHFPFTEPSCEMDVQCHKCGGKGCPTCKGEGWIELLGAGVTNPHVHEMSGIDPATHSGLAWGMGLERAAMRRFKIADLRLMFENVTSILTSLMKQGVIVRRRYGKIYITDRGVLYARYYDELVEKILQHFPLAGEGFTPEECYSAAVAMAVSLPAREIDEKCESLYGEDCREGS